MKKTPMDFGERNQREMRNKQALAKENEDLDEDELQCILMKEIEIQTWIEIQYN